MVLLEEEELGEKLKRRVWIRDNDIVIIAPWEIWTW